MGCVEACMKKGALADQTTLFDFHKHLSRVVCITDLSAECLIHTWCVGPVSKHFMRGRSWVRVQRVACAFSRSSAKVQACRLFNEHLVAWHIHLDCKLRKLVAIKPLKNSSPKSHAVAMSCSIVTSPYTSRKLNKIWLQGKLLQQIISGDLFLDYIFQSFAIQPLHLNFVLAARLYLSLFFLSSLDIFHINVLCSSFYTLVQFTLSLYLFFCLVSVLLKQ